ncbi:MAG: hypothetical protein ACRC8K_08965 [Waterburya sp.]
MSEVLLKELTNSDIEWLTANGDRRGMPAGSLLVRDGKVPKFLHILLDGCLSVTVSSVNNNPLTRAYAAIP